MNYSSSHHFFFFPAKKLNQFFTAISFFLLLLFSATLNAAGNCSPYLGQASLNEFFKNKSNMAYDVADFVEVKILNDTITSSIFETWTIKICEQNDAGNNNDADGCSGTISLIDFTDKTKPWLIMDGTASSGSIEIGKYINFKTGFDAILLDSNADVIDYLTVDGYNPQEQVGCNGTSTPALPFDYQTTAPGASDKFIFRTPDGSGDWGSAPSASAPPSENDTNDTAPDGGTLPTISVTDVTVNKGQTATFTFSMDKTVNYAVTVDYQTTGGNAIANTTNPAAYDYSYNSGTITFPANTTSLTTTVNITTNSATPSTTATVFFYLYLYNQVNAKILNTYPIGTILGNATAEWYMDESAWNDIADEVSEFNATNHGTPFSGVTTNGVNKVLCRSGSFDGIDDYIEIPHHSSLVGSNQLSYSIWINPTTWSGSNIVMSKSVLNGSAQMGIYSESGRLVGRVETSAGPIQVFTDLPVLTSWTHIALVFNENSLTFYINGAVASNFSVAETSSIVFNTTTLVSNSDPLTIGKQVSAAAKYFNGYIDEVLVMQSSLPAAFINTIYNNYLSGLNWNGVARSCPSSLHHIEFIHDGAAVTCNSEAITVKACSAADCSTTLTSAVTIDLLPTGWVGGDSQTFSAGSAIYNLKHTVAETITLNTSSSTPIASNPVVCKDSGGTVISCDVVFSDSGLIFYNDTDVSTLIPTQLSGKDSNVGYNEKTLTLQAVKKSDNDPAQCAAAFQNKTLNIDFAAECKNPGNCIAGQSFALNGAALTATTDNDLLSGSSSYDTRSITFDANGKYNIIFNYPEAGLIELHARHNILLADGTTPSGNYMSGSSSFVVRPLGISLDVLGQRAADYADNSVLDDSTGSNFSFAADASGSVFKKAGETFTTTLTAIQWQAADDTNNDGIADSGANLTNNTTTQNFGNETAAIVPANITLTQTTTLANAGILTNSANSTSFVNGVGTKTIDLSEVGVFDLTATLNSYLAADNIVTLTPSFGRFVPDHFDTTLLHGCTGGSTFSYSGQPFAVTSIAKNTLNNTTLNYSGSFAFDGTLSNAGVSPVVNFTNNTIPAVNFVNGIGTRADVTYTFATKETLPETITLRARDADTLSATGVTESSTEIRSGRSNIENNFGSELIDMLMTTETQYYSSNGFEINTADTCSFISATLTDIGTDTVTIGDGSATGQSCIWDDDAESGTNNCTFAALLPGPAASQFIEPPVTGNFNLYLKAPGQNFTGDIAVTLTSPTWLQFDWDGDGNNDNDPTGVASFGLYRGDDRVIYWREVF